MTAATTQKYADTLRDVDVDNTAQVCKTSLGRLLGLHVQNPNTSDAWLHFYDAATGDVTVGTTTPKVSFLIPASGAYAESFSPENAISFATAITYAATTTVTGSTDPTTGLVANLFYR